MLPEHTLLIGSYDYRLVALSVVIATFTSYTTLDLAGRVNFASGWARVKWLAGGASAMGLGIWSMHYMGMLAFRLPIPVRYDWPIVLLSLLAAIFASAAALYVASGNGMSLWRTAFGSLVMGAGIGAMHYIGMNAMRMSATCHFDPSIVVLSLVLAVGISFLTIRLVFRARNQSETGRLRKIASAIVMGTAIPIMHYTGMASATFTVSGVPPDLSHAVAGSTLGTIGIAAVTIMVLGIAVLTAAYSRLVREPHTLRTRVLSARIRALRAAMTTFCIVLVFEVAKQALHHKITDWASHTATILFATLVAAILSFIILRKEERFRFELAASEVQYRLLFDGNPLPTWVFARKTLKFLAVNEAAIQHYGFSRQQFLAMTILDIRPPEDIPALLEATAKLIRGLHRETGIWRHRKKDGTIIDVEIVSHDLDFHGIEAELVAAHDVTDRKRSEEMLQNSESKYRVLFEDSADANWLIDKNGFVDCNSAALLMFGYTRGEPLPHAADISPANQPDGTSSTMVAEQKVAAAFLNGKERFEWLHQRKNGDVFPAEVCLTALTLSGQPMLLATVRDITERRQAEESLKLFRLLLDQSNDAIEVVELGTMRLLDVNEKACTSLGYTREELLSMSVFDIDPSVKELKRANVETELRKSGFIMLQTLHRRKDGSTFPVEISMKYIQLDRSYVVCAIRDITERKRAEEALRESEDRYRDLVQHSNDLICTHDLEGKLLSVNPAAITISGYSKEELLAMNLRDLIVPQVRGQFENYLAEVKSKGTAIGLMPVQTKSGEKRIWEYDNSLRTRDNAAAVVRGTARDITERKRTEQDLRQAEEKYRMIYEGAVVGIFQSHVSGHYLGVNPEMARMFGYDSPQELLISITDISRQIYVDPKNREAFRLLMEEQGVVQDFEHQVYRKDGSKIWVSVNARAMTKDGVLIGYEGTNVDITARKIAQDRVQYLAYYDALTGLPNRSLLEDRLSQALANARRRKDKVALLFLDLDRFKVINDSLGHSIGDLLLQDVAERLKKFAREQDTVARLGGDEFLIVLTAVKDCPDAAVAAERLMDAMTAGFVIQGHSFGMNCSLGISIFPEHGADSETLIKNADAAMYTAKDYGRNNFRFFTEDMNALVVERLTLENSLRLALERKEFFLVYQPQMDILTGQITGLEALLRWQHPELGLVPPDKFIRIAENCGLIVPIGEWVLRTACSQARKWHTEGIQAVPVAVNVSAVQFRQEAFCDLVRKVLRETGLAAKYLELEITESLLLSNADVMFSVFRELKAMGLKLAIDDFGTGYSSLSYLKQFPVSKLKIDRSFVQDVAVNADDAAITTAIIGMAKSLNLRVIAEGVENEAQMSFLRTRHCDEIQGYYFSRPLSADAVADKMQGTEALALSANPGA
jgi:diguanylate cyclase (GGDEF)-like protein/PAS domain S-box-containing protein